MNGLGEINRYQFILAAMPGRALSKKGEFTMEITVSHEQGRVPVTVMSLRGEFDALSADEFEKCARQLIAAGARQLLIDLEQAPHLNRIGILAIDHVLFLALARQPREDRGAMYAGICAGTFQSPYLKLVNLTPRALEAMHTAGTNMYLETHRDLKSAIASFGPGLPQPKKESDVPAIARPVGTWLRNQLAL
jgi:hypothetical protein